MTEQGVNLRPTKRGQFSTGVDKLLVLMVGSVMERSKEPPRSPSGRVPKWVLDEHAGHAPDTAWRSAGTPPPGGVTRPDGAPFGGDTLVQAGIARLSEVTGLQFVNDGTTDEQPRPKREPFQPDRYGDRWAPVLIAWQSAQDNPDLVSDVTGEAGSVLVGTDGNPAVYVSGQVVLDGAQFTDILTRPDGQAEARGIILHELGHLVGLDHVEDPTQIMYPRSQAGVSDYAAGDLTGLAALGQGPCAPWL